jgi:hypothetical protein
LSGTIQCACGYTQVIRLPEDAPASCPKCGAGKVVAGKPNRALRRAAAARSRKVVPLREVFTCTAGDIRAVNAEDGTMAELVQQLNDAGIVSTTQLQITNGEVVIVTPPVEPEPENAA